MTGHPNDQATQYYRRREGEERYAAQQADSPSGREAHANLADCYADRLKDLAAASAR
jgi:hypothetical protein